LTSKKNACCLDLLFGPYKLLIQTFYHDLDSAEHAHTNFCWVLNIIDYKSKQLATLTIHFVPTLMHMEERLNPIDFYL